ncbi:type IA DNA topoisomerase [Paenibacillus lutrae]|uniref:DNA topoisomerase n=1 Tax=Paenibacillus lutrae TaxID=2078573 RepID=A0A7X3FLY2_9BACL|nr:type IA DNA topoisomerase [Paenibacillus lutrae]MVP02146.1 type IA DNA topoisomerase [Paenibacillus lutrae]
MQVILAEKPDMARNIADVLGVKKANRGYIELQNGNIVTWAIGHLIRLRTPDSYEEYKTWSLNTLPIIPEPMLSEVDPDRKDQFLVIRELLSKADSCVIATDPGREGEHIGRTIISACGFKGNLLRLWIQDLTSETIKSGFQQLRSAADYENLAAAARIRAAADYWIGFTATRFFSLVAQEVSGEKALLSAGRVQTPTLRIVYDREMAIEGFKSQTFYQLLGTFTTSSGNYEGKWFRFQDEKISRLDTIEEAEALLKKVAGQPGTVTHFEEKQVKRYAPQLLDSTSIKKAARKQLGFSIEKTDKTLQSIYDKGFCTYPRTASVHLSSNAADKLAKDLAAIRLKSKFFSLFPKDIHSLKGKPRFVDDEKAAEHHAIVPTGLVPAELTEDEEKLYEIILRVTLAAHHPEGTDSEITAITTIADETFETKAVSILEQGWRKILKPESEEKGADEVAASLPNLQIGQVASAQDMRPVIGKTTPPKRLAEDELIEQMAKAGRKIEDDEELAAVLKDLGIGTPATRSTIVQELKKREYIESKKNLIYLTDKGRNFMSLIHDHPLASIELTAEFEKKLTEVAEGRRSAAQTREEFKSFVHRIMGTKDELQQKIRERMKEKSLFQNIAFIGKCPACNKPVTEKKEFYGCSGFKEGCKITIPKEYMKIKLSVKHAAALLEGKEIMFQGIQGKFGPYSLILKFENQKIQSRKPTLEELSLGSCPLCQKGVRENEKFYGCSGYKEGCKFTLPKTFLGKPITSAQVRKLLRNGKTDVIKGFTAKDKTFDSALVYDKQEGRLKFAR